MKPPICEICDKRIEDMDKGGLVVVISGAAMITAYNWS